MTSGFINHKYNRMYCAQFVSWTITLLAQLADSFLGGICISEDAVSAVGLVHPIFSIVMFVSTVFASGGSTKFSNYAGAFDKENARRSAGTGLLGAELSGIVIAVVMIFGEKQFFRFYAAGAAVEAMAREYYRYMLLTAVVYPVYLVLYDLVTIDGDEARMLALSCIASGFVYEWIVTFPEIDRAGPGNLTAFVYMLAAPLVFPAAFSVFWDFKGMIWGFFLAPFAAISATSLFIVLRYGRSAFPYAVPRNDNTVFMYEFAMSGNDDLRR